MLGLISKEEGLRGLFRGISATTIAYILDRGIWFPAYQSLKTVFVDKFGLKPDSIALQLNSSISASLFSVIISNPIWVIRTRIMVGLESIHLGLWVLIERLGISHFTNHKI
jgi:solute carrier family 25 folate transporter 32